MVLPMYEPDDLDKTRHSPVFGTGVPRFALTLHEAAEALGISPRFLQDLDAPCVRLGTRRVYPIDALRSWINDRAKDRDRGDAA